MLCVGLVKSQMKADDEFVCKKCRKIPSSKSSSPITVTTNNRKSIAKVDASKQNTTNTTPTTNTNSKKRQTRAEENFDVDKDEGKPTNTNNIKTFANVLHSPNASPRNTNMTAATNPSQSQLAAALNVADTKKKKKLPQK